MKLEEKTLRKNTLYEGHIINLRRDDVELPNGKTALREIVEHRGGVCVLAFTDRDELLFVRQFRYAYHDLVLEIPAGKRDSADEDPRDCGIRELREETGATADKITYLGEVYPSPGYTEEIIHIFMAEGLHFGKDDLDDDEFLDVERIPFDTALGMVLSGEIKDAKTQIAILKAAVLRKQGDR